ncbi:hypothetical protein [Cytobacillus horneckiae]|uniref:Uncharacterized protein n=1 Tax=Cytobacillus horneckiae TaxID=549687 RepID=A0A2N0ZB66_9BACI|nr:hypothetical protein [Cytobacillus horneckiae]MEC1155537.1 hypothetical protein [Cytobacillus horneckiae]MED2936856.1 hypothetical protein [Cytobacillus horneckiae]PKG26725.1 hypothetical protein CWS20_22350 [Cytobacillus horneckiae]
MLVLIISVILWMFLAVYAIKTVKEYRQSTKKEKKQKHRLMIYVVGSVPLAAILLIGENLKLQGFTMNEIMPYLFVAAIIFIFVPGYIYLFMTLFSKDTYESYGEPNKYKSKFIFKNRKLLVPIIVALPIVIITFTIVKIGEALF